MSLFTMQAIRVHHYGDPEQLKLEQIPRPEPQASEVLLRVHSAGVNPADWKIRQGWAKDFMPWPLPYIPGSDVAGIVEAVGLSVTAFQPGQAAFGMLSQRGAYAEYATAPVKTLALKPKTLTFDEAAAIPTGAITAWQALFDVGNLRAGQRVLIQGAAGGVGLFAVQFARRIGAQVIGTASTANVDFVRSLGADAVIDYISTPFEQVVHDVDLVVDTIGGEITNRSLDVVKRGGTIVVAGYTRPDPSLSQPTQEKAQDLGIQAAMVLAQPSSELLQTFAQLIDEGHVRAVVGRTFPLHEARFAHELSQTGHGRGRIVLHLTDEDLERA
jgi:NADPH:quinone reductase-like Zn-dependent oxidoreductase